MAAKTKSPPKRPPASFTAAEISFLEIANSQIKEEFALENSILIAKRAAESVVDITDPLNYPPDFEARLKTFLRTSHEPAPADGMTCTSSATQRDIDPRFQSMQTCCRAILDIANRMTSTNAFEIKKEATQLRALIRDASLLVKPSAE